MSLRRELRAAAGFVLGLLGFFLAYVHRGGLLAAPFAAPLLAAAAAHLADGLVVPSGNGSALPVTLIHLQA